MSVADVLERAADLIVERGWCQGVYEDKGGHVCVRGAIHVAAGGTLDGNRDIGVASWEPAVILVHHLGRSIPSWNDDPSRTADEVITALRDCAAAERAKP